MILPDEIGWIGVFILALYFTDSAYGHNPFVSGDEIGYATILTWVRATGHMFISAICWLFLALMTITLNNCDNAFSACFTSPTFATTTGTISVNIISKSLPYLFYGLFWLNLVMGVVITLYLVLPTERRPKSFNLFQQGRGGQGTRGS